MVKKKTKKSHKKKKILGKKNFKSKKKSFKGGANTHSKNPLSKKEFAKFMVILEKTVELFDGIPEENLYDEEDNLKPNILTYKTRFLAGMLNRGDGLIPFNDYDRDVARILNGIESFPQHNDLIRRGIYFTSSYVIKEHNNRLGSNPVRVKQVLKQIKELTSVFTFQALCTYRFIKYTHQGQDKFATIMPKGIDAVDFLNSAESFSLEKILQFCLDLTDTVMKLARNNLFYIDLKLENIAVFNENGENNLYLIDIDSIVGPNTRAKVTYCSKNLSNKPISEGFDKNMLYILYGLYVTVFMLIYFSKDIAEEYKDECCDLDKLLFEQNRNHILPGCEDNQFAIYLYNGRRANSSKPLQGTFVLEHPNLRRLDKVNNTINHFLDSIRPFFTSNPTDIQNYTQEELIEKCIDLKKNLILDLGNL